MRCTTCNAENGSKSKFCRQCGASLSLRPEPVAKDAVKRCDGCKVVASSDAQFCTGCGGPLSVASQPGHVFAKPPRQPSNALTYALTGAACIALAGLYLHVMGGGNVIPRATQATAAPTVSAAPSIGTSTAGPRPWLAALRTDLRKCDGESIFAQPFCREKAKFKHCRPDRWGTVSECPQARLPDEGSG